MHGTVSDTAVRKPLASEQSMQAGAGQSILNISPVCCLPGRLVIVCIDLLIDSPQDNTDSPQAYINIFLGRSELVSVAPANKREATLHGCRIGSSITDAVRQWI